jgi:thioredoxin reductase
VERFSTWPMRELELLIVGAGPAGVAAAREALQRGVQVLVVDEQPLGQLDALAELPRGADVLAGHGAWGVFPGDDAMTVGLFDGTGTFLVRAHELVLATGATDVDLAFPGSDLAGVIGGRELLRQMRTSGAGAARRMVVLGSGEVATEVVRRARRVGVDVVALVGPGASAADVPVYAQCTIRRAVGDNRVEHVELARFDCDSDAVDVSIDADALCVAIGSQPAIELAYLAGCPIDYDQRLGVHVPRSISGVTVTGDLAGTVDVHDPVWHRLADRFATDDTVVCACEGVTRGQIVDVLPRAYGHPDEVKRLTRAGMGVCQGRRCRVSIASLMAHRLGVSLRDVPVASFRPPVRLLPLAALATEEQPHLPACYAPFAAAEARLTDALRQGRLRPLALVRFRRAALEAAYRREREGASNLEIEASARELEAETREGEARR